MEYDNILTQIGEFGHFQRRVFFVVCLIKIFHVFKVLGYVFWAVRLEHWCHVDRPEQFKNISDELWKNWTIPSKIDPTGQLQYESCFQYSYADNITLLSQYLNEHDTDVVRMEQGNWTHRDEESAAISQCKSWDYDTHQYVSSIVSKVGLQLLPQLTIVFILVDNVLVYSNFEYCLTIEKKHFVSLYSYSLFLSIYSGGKLTYRI